MSIFKIYKALHSAVAITPNGSVACGTTVATGGGGRGGGNRNPEFILIIGLGISFVLSRKK